MKTIQRIVASAILLALTGTTITLDMAVAGDVPKEAVLMTPGKFQFKPNLKVAGLERADMIGSDTKPGPYLFRTKFPPNFKLEAHGHPDERRYTIVSGTWYVGWGKKFDESKLIALPAGSFYTEPANIPHFVVTKGDGAVIEISGVGPSSQIWVDPAHAPKK